LRGDDSGAQISERDRRDLAALADGSMPPDRRGKAEARIASAPALQVSLQRQRQVVASLTGVAAYASPALRARVSSLGDRRGRVHRRVVVGLAVAVAFAALVVLPLRGANPTVPEIARLAERPVAGPAPEPRRGERARLDTEFEGLAYPNWANGGFGWTASGTRSDEIDGRSTQTVFYEKRGRQLAYTIVSGDTLDPPGDARPARHEGLQLASFHDNGELVVTWHRDGHTCVLSGADAERTTLLDLAAWTGDGAV